MVGSCFVLSGACFLVKILVVFCAHLLSVVSCVVIAVSLLIEEGRYVRVMIRARSVLPPGGAAVRLTRRRSRPAAGSAVRRLTWPATGAR